jgi:cyclase
MVKKRVIGVVTVRGNLAVQSVSYNTYYPLGDPVLLAENLDRWGADEIFVQCIDRSIDAKGPNFDLVSRISKAGISTPVMYGGGIGSVHDAVRVVNLGADRVVVDSLLWTDPTIVPQIARELGIQAIIGNLPVKFLHDQVIWKNYNTGHEIPIDNSFRDVCPLDNIAEVVLTDYQHEGITLGFDERLTHALSVIDKPGILFGGISDKSQIARLLDIPLVVAVASGNFLSHREHALQCLVDSQHLRSRTYMKEEASICL